MGVLNTLEPKKVFQYFEEITQIPHGSGNCKQISDYLVKYAKDHHLTYQQDDMLNVIIIKEATPGYEDVEPIVIQGHMDMVAVKDADCDIDLEKDPLRIRVDGDYIDAEGTSLGGDDGIAVAYALAILDDDSLQHPRIEVIITTEEEVGMEGATALDASICKGRRMLNIDSEEEGILLTSCAGGCRAHAEIPVVREEKSGILYEVAFEQMLGGHSGTEIDKEHGNAIKFLAKALSILRQDVEFSVAEMCGGEKDNAIACDSIAELLIQEKDSNTFETAMEKIKEIFYSEYGTKEPNMKIRCTRKDLKTVSVLNAKSTEDVINYLLIVPNGIQNMSIDIKGLVETSLNIGIMRLYDDKLTTDSAIRSSIDSAKQTLKEQVKIICEMYGGTMSYYGEYPGWQYNPDSKLRKKMLTIYKEMFGKEAEVQALHAGLECGILCEKLPGLDCVSFGPDILDIHTTSERLSISSTKRMWDYIVRILAEK